MEHLNHFLSTDRKSFITEPNGFLNILPKDLFKAVVVGYIYDDVFNDFRKFFRADLYLDTTMLEELAFGLKPRFFLGSGNTK